MCLLWAPPRTSSLGSTAEFMVGGALSGWKTLHVLLACPSQAHLGFPLHVSPGLASWAHSWEHVSWGCAQELGSSG